MTKSQQALYRSFLKAHEAGEAPSPEAMDAAAELLRAQVAKRPAGRPRRKLGDVRVQRGLEAALDVEVRVEQGETYAQARADVARERGISMRQLERYGRFYKPMHAFHLAIRQACDPLRALLQPLKSLNNIGQSLLRITAPLDAFRQALAKSFDDMHLKDDSQEQDHAQPPKIHPYFLSSPDSLGAP